MLDRNYLIASLKGRIWGGEIHKGGYIHVPQEEAEAILELLKEQEPVKPISPLSPHGDGIYFCNKCMNFIGTHDKFCAQCGRPVKWDD